MNYSSNNDSINCSIYLYFNSSIIVEDGAITCTTPNLRTKIIPTKIR